MHSVTLVLLPVDTHDLWQAGSDLLRPHRIDEDELGRPWRLDYWTVGGEHFADEESAALVGVVDDPELARNVCLVSRLRPDFTPSVLVTPDGAWYDLSDHRWRFVDGGSPANLAAEALWAEQVRRLLAAHADCIAVEFDTHS